MRHIGIISTPVPGHLNPMIALGRELHERGYAVTFFNMEDLRSTIEQEGLAFSPLGLSSHPAGTLTGTKSRLGALSGFAAIRYTLRAVHGTTEMICRDAPAAIRAAQIDVLVVDQMEPAGASVAQYLGIPFVTVANALLLNREPSVPPALSPWRYRADFIGRTRNRVGYLVGDILFRPILGELNQYRRAWKLPHISCDEETFSPLAQISQLAPEFDFPRSRLPACFHFTGPLRKPGARRVDFPWHRLNGKRLVYASLGTLQGQKVHVFELIAAACRDLDVQLVITHGGGLSAKQEKEFSGHPLVVPFAPQLDVLKRAALTVTHAGLNTVLDSFSCGVPVVAIPITFEQPAIAERVRWSGGGEVAPLRGLTAEKLREVIRFVLESPSHRASARRMQASIEKAGGVRLAADIVATLSATPLAPSKAARDREERVELVNGTSR